MSMILVKNISRDFHYYKKAEGIKGSIRNLFSRQIVVKKAVDDISFEVFDGEIIGLLGPNGAGKTTTLKILAGILYPSSGSALINGFIPWERKNEFRKLIAILLGNKSQLWIDLPAVDSFVINKNIYEIDDMTYRKRVSELSEMFNVTHLLNVQVRRLSLGERMKLEIISSILHNPKVIFLDEPTIGLDLISQKSMREFISQYNRHYKATIIITSHNTADIEALCRRVVIIKEGRIAYDGQISSIDDQLNRYKVINIKSDMVMNDEMFLMIEGVDRVSIVDDHSCSIRVERERTNSVAACILQQGNISDINIEEYPIELQIENIFLKGLVTR
jgi:ABC-type uncharacterized transport system, ATPase component